MFRTLAGEVATATIALSYLAEKVYTIRGESGRAAEKGAAGRGDDISYGTLLIIVVQGVIIALGVLGAIV